VSCGDVGSFAAKSSANTRHGFVLRIPARRALLQIFIKTTPHHRLQSWWAILFLSLNFCGFLSCWLARFSISALKGFTNAMSINRRGVTFNTICRQLILL
jgi:hypothetical protein